MSKKGICPYCGHNSYEKWTELDYENQDDPTPEYGGRLIPIEIESCGNCGIDEKLIDRRINSE